jgi:hypothetical protein
MKHVTVTHLSYKEGTHSVSPGVLTSHIYHLRTSFLQHLLEGLLEVDP